MILNVKILLNAKERIPPCNLFSYFFWIEGNLGHGSVGLMINLEFSSCENFRSTFEGKLGGKLGTDEMSQLGRWEMFSLSATVAN